MKNPLNLRHSTSYAPAALLCDMTHSRVTRPDFLGGPTISYTQQRLISKHHELPTYAHAHTASPGSNFSQITCGELQTQDLSESTQFEVQFHHHRHSLGLRFEEKGKETGFQTHRFTIPTGRYVPLKLNRYVCWDRLALGCRPVHKDY